ncbi:MAG: putative bifunctional diguanylate cyclase/phosphodiesterase [Campylobacterales bacterium]
MPKKTKSIKKYIIIGTLICSIGGFIIFSAAGFYFFKELTENRAREVANGLAMQTFNSMYQVMKRGWSREDLEEFISATKRSYKDSSTKIEIYRSPVVENLYGKIEQSVTPEVENVFQAGRIYTKDGSGQLDFIYPIRADSSCLSCHTNAKAGSILGAIEVKQNLDELLDTTKKEYLSVMLFLLPIPIIIAYLIATWMVRPLRKSAKQIEQNIKEVNSIRDLSLFTTSSLFTGVKEFDQIVEEIQKLTEKLKNIAADRDLLEFEVRLLDKFIITSDIVKDWREHVKDLLTEINTVMEAYSLFVMFKLEEESYDIEIFWIDEPSEYTKNMFEEIVSQRIKSNPYFSDFTHLKINHHSVRRGKEPLNLTRKDIELQTKSLILSTPKIGGVVGIGVHSELSQDQTRYIVIESILTTLINVIGSVKAIYKYTKDLEYYAIRDPLTNLYNQRVFRELLGYEIGRATRRGYKFGILMLDFDDFKAINDKYGHDFGDRFLTDYADFIQKTLRAEDIPARYGGDEFVVILPEADSEQAYLVAKNIKEAINKHSIKADDGEDVRATVSIGYSIYPDHGKDIEELFIIADNMMYKAKSEGKNTISIPTEDDIKASFDKANKKMNLVMKTLEDKNLIPNFQPIMRCSDRKIEIYELLMRIKSEGKLIPASEFIDTAESMGVVHKMDYILIEKAFEKLQESNFDGLLFINISPKALIVGEFIGYIKNMCKEYSFSTENIVIEISEKDCVKNITLLEKFVYDLKMENFRFAIDNFGTGLSTFTYLKRLPIDYIKIDGEFVRNIKKDRSDRALIKSIVTLTKELGIQTIAESVEDQEVLEEIIEVGIDFVQGYHIGVPSEKVAKK